MCRTAIGPEVNTRQKRLIVIIFRLFNLVSLKILKFTTKKVYFHLIKNKK